MATGILSRDRALGDLLQSIINRIAKLEQPKVIHVGPIGGVVSPLVPGYTLSINAAGQLIATSDNGTVTLLANP